MLPLHPAQYHDHHLCRWKELGLSCQRGLQQEGRSPGRGSRSTVVSEEQPKGGGSCCVFAGASVHRHVGGQLHVSQHFAYLKLETH